MPSREGQPYEPNLAPPPLHSAQKVWVCRFTGALFSGYEDYLKQLALYRQRTWSCKHTNKEGLTYEEALTEEAKVQGLLDQFPDCYEGPVAKLVHHATLKLDDLCQRLASFFKDRFVPGEDVLAMRDEVETACRVVAAVDSADLDHDSQALSTGAAVTSPDPEDEYKVEWLSDGATSVLKRYELFRKRVPLSRAVIKSWLPLVAEAETITGMKGIPCIWRINAELSALYGLPQELPASLKERMERAQQRREQQSRRTSKTEQDFVQLDAGEIEDDDDEDYEESMSGRVMERKPEAKAAVPVEPLETTRARLKPGTVKRVLFDALEAAGEHGLSIPALVDAVQAAGVKTWEGARSANSSIAATCTHDSAFVRLGPGQITLRAMKHRPRAAATAAAAASGRAQSEELAVSRSPQVERNTLKCPRCHLTVHPSGSPLLLCDTCPRSFHLECLGLAYEELPEDEWQCPKCHDRRAGAARRLAAGFVRATAADRPDGSVRDEKSFLRERAKEMAKWAALHPVDDLEMLEDLEEALAAAETEAHMAAEEVARASRRPAGKPEAAAAGGGTDERLARLQKKAKRAADRVAELRLVIEGPPQLQPGVSSEAAKAALYDALAVVDFLTIFGASFDAAPLTLLEIQQAAAYPLDTPNLQDLYIALLRCLLLEAMGMEGVVRSRAKRWSRVIDERTWPEVLRRYLLASRAGLPVPEGLASIQLEAVNTAALDDNAACITAAKLLEAHPFHRLPAGLHLRVLMALCNDVTECSTLRNEIAARVEEMNQIQAQFRQKQNEGRKKLKEEATKMTLAEEKADDKAEAQPPAEGDEGKPEGQQEPGENGDAPTKADPEAAVKPEEDSATAAVKEASQPPKSEQPEQAAEPSQPEQAEDGKAENQAGKGAAGRQKDRRKKRHKTAADKRAEAAQQQAALQAQERVFEETLKEREAELEEALDARAIRDDVIGEDRQFRRYWWFPGEQAVVFVEEPEGESLSAIDAPEQLDALLERLNRSGLREKLLHQNLAKRRDAILGSLGYHAVNLDVAQAPRPEAAKPAEEAAAAAEADRVQASVKLMLGFLEEMDKIPAAPVTTSVADWKARLNAVSTFEELGRAAIDLEADVNGLGVGLPTGADDATLAGFGKKTKAALRAEQEAVEETRDESDEGPSKDPSGLAPMEVEPTANGNGRAAASEDGLHNADGENDGEGTGKGASGFDGSLPPTERVKRLFKDSELVMPTDFVDALEELEASDSEVSKNRRGGTLWRSARERKAWLRDARRSLISCDASCAAYITSVLVDRAQPLLRSLLRATKRAEKEAAEWEAIEAAADSSQEGTPVPQSKTERLFKAGRASGTPAKGKRSRRSGEGAGRFPSRLGDGPPSKKARAPKQENSDSEATETDDDGPPPSRHGDHCHTCGEEGDLLNCEAPDCTVAQHVACAGLDEAPTDYWYCAEHRTRPSIKRSRSRSGARQSLEPQAKKAARRRGG